MTADSNYEQAHRLIRGGNVSADAAVVAYAMLAVADAIHALARYGAVPQRLVLNADVKDGRL